MEPLKQVQVEGQLMFAEPHDLFGNLDEVCSVREQCFMPIFTSFKEMNNGPHIRTINL